ncbi:ammonium transporter AmtB-like domain-containing protein [Boletus edulis]|nr:ammonium transporter AmtB-like domain-containing protein [Boletus edulis]
MAPNVTYDSSGDLQAPLGGVYNEGDIAWVLASTALVWIMIPGVGFFYSGLLRRKNALSMIYLSMMTVAVVSFQWFFWGYSLSFSPTANKFIGNLDNFALMNVFSQPSAGSPRVPAIVFCVFQLMFAAITPMIAIGAVAERTRLGPLLVFVFVWSTLVYDPIACWTWNPKGWSYILGGLDFAGGTPVHISSGTAALAISLYLGKRRGYGTERLAYKPHNTTYVILGTCFLWFGWFGFNGGSALSANYRATQACIVTNLAASVGGLVWMLWDWRLERKWSAVGFCSGAIAGLVAITPASGFVGSPAAVLFGFMAGTVCNFATQLKFLFKYDDTLDIFASHAVGGVVGNLLTGLFAQASVAGADGITTIPGGWLDQNYRQLGIQLADSASGLSYSFVMTTIILWVMHFIPFLRLRCDEETEIIGVDDAEMGEFAYDYVGIEAELLPRQEYNNTATGGSREPQHTVSISQESEHEKTANVPALNA